MEHPSYPRSIQLSRYVTFSLPLLCHYHYYIQDNGTNIISSTAPHQYTGVTSLLYLIIIIIGVMLFRCEKNAIMHTHTLMTATISHHVRYSTYDNLVMMHSVDHAVSLLFDIKDVRKREGKKPLPLPAVPVY